MKLNQGLCLWLLWLAIGLLPAQAQPTAGHAQHPPAAEVRQTTVRSASASRKHCSAPRPLATYLRGEVYFDANGDGYRGANEGAFPQPVLVEDVAHGYGLTVGPTMGNFVVPSDTGDFDLQATGLPEYYRLIQGYAGYQGYLSRFGQSVSGLNFGIASTGAYADLRVTLTPYSPLRAGLPQRYRARVENVGTMTVASATVEISINGSITIVGTVPASAPSSGNGRTWQVTNLAPFGVQNLDLTFSLPITTPAGTTISAQAAITAMTGSDYHPADNTDTLQHTVVASYDPNDIAVNLTQMSLAQVAAGQMLDYLIRFENVGNDTAFSVVIVDTLPANAFQLGTLRLVGASHNCQWSIRNRVLTMRFTNIRLPYRAIDVLRSQGFARFRVRPLNTLDAGTLIPGVAHITFDFNSPITTNQVTTVIGSPNGTSDLLDTPTVSWDLYPNPATAAATLSTDVVIAGQVVVDVVDALGRLVQTQRLVVEAGALRLPLDLRRLLPGAYVVRLTLPGRPPATRRLLVHNNP